MYLHWNTENIIGFSFFISFGIIAVVFPRNVIRFYRWFHKGGIALHEDAQGIRAVLISGALWILLMLCVAIFAKPNGTVQTKTTLTQLIPPYSSKAYNTLPFRDQRVRLFG